MSNPEGIDWQLLRAATATVAWYDEYISDRETYGDEMEELRAAVDACRKKVGDDIEAVQQARGIEA